MQRNGARRRRGVEGRTERRSRFWLESLEGRELLAVVLNTADSGPGSLRQAIIDTNNDPNDNSIAFNIAGTGVHTIALLSPLDEITSPVTLDATTQPGTGSTPTIELDGTNAGSGAAGLVVTAGGTTIRGLAINRFSGEGLILRTGGTNRVEQNVIGLDPTGTISRPNGGDGILIDNSASNTIGGTASAARNIIAANAGVGVQVAGVNSDLNLLQNNVIGTNAGGTLNLGNGSDGVRINGGSGNSIGGSIAAAANTIAFNGGDGVRILAGSENLIRRNSTFSNTGLGINLDPGANGDIAAPQLFGAVTSNGVTTVTGQVTGAPNTTFTVDFYSNTTIDSSTTAEGRTWVGNASIVTNSSGVGTFSVTTATAVTVGQFLVATSTSPTNNTSEFSAPVRNIAPTANVAISGTVSPNPVAMNGFLTYTYTITNAGPTAATVTFTDTLPSTLSFVQTTASQGNASRSGNTVTVSLGSVNPGANATVTIVVVPTAVNAALSNTATITAPEDSDTSNNSVTLTTDVQQGINLLVQPSATPNPVGVGDQLALTYIVTNTGPATSTATTFQSTMPGNVELVSVTSSQGTVAIGPGNTSYSVSLLTLGPNASASITAIVKPGAAGTVSVTGTASGVQPEINPADNTGTATATVQTVIPPTPSDTTPPIVTSLSRFGRGAQPTDYFLVFSEALNPSTAENEANYQLVTAGPDGRFNTRDDVKLALASVVYNEAQRSVTVQPRQRIPLSRRVQLTVNGTSATGVADLNGNLLDGNYDGQAGSDFVWVIRRFGPGPLTSNASISATLARRLARHGARV
jgi:uncharacterized repeat protein (TIGR01451 family)